MSYARNCFVAIQVQKGLTREAANRAADHMIVGHVVPDTITDASERALAYAMLSEEDRHTADERARAHRVSPALLRALADLREGDPIPSQESNVRRHLKALVARDFVRILPGRPGLPYVTAAGNQALLLAADHAGVED